MSEPRSKKAKSACYKRARVFLGGHQKKQLEVPATAAIALIASTCVPTHPAIAPSQPTSTLAPTLPPTPVSTPVPTPTPTPTLSTVAVPSASRNKLALFKASFRPQSTSQPDFSDDYHLVKVSNIVKSMGFLHCACGSPVTVKEDGSLRRGLVSSIAVLVLSVL